MVIPKGKTVAALQAAMLPIGNTLFPGLLKRRETG